MREGSAEVSIACPAEAAFGWLADPRHADEWFANVALPEPPVRPLRAGATWRFHMTRQRGRSIPMRLAEYQPPRAFTWETAYPAWRSNLQWACALEPEPAAPGEASGATRLRLTIRQRPGPLGWPALLLAALLGQLRVTEAASMPARAERAAQRAGEALEALPTLSYTAERRPPRPPRGGKGGARGGKSKRR
jgi:uncharacterized protein YndB with AHSA1/START domain